MPEGDTLWRTAAALQERIAGQICREVMPVSFRRLAGKRVEAVEAAGKHLFIRFEGGLSLHSHMRMRGAWYIHRHGERFRRPDHELKVLLTFDEWVAVLFAAPVVEIVGGQQRVSHLGPDILSENFDRDEVIRRALLDRDRCIGEVLLDQRVCAGIGNIYRCESLWAHRISPWTPTGAVGESEVGRLYETARRMMLASARGVEVTRRNDVHGRGGRSCRRCGHLIHVRNQGNPPRLAYWCPKCQRGTERA